MDEDTDCQFHDALEHKELELDLKVTQEVTHVVNTLNNIEGTNDSLVYKAPAVSVEAGLELLKVQELEVNLSI